MSIIRSTKGSKTLIMGNLPPLPFDIVTTVVWPAIKWALVLASGLFVGFGVVMLSQVRQMVATIKRPFNSMIVIGSVTYFGITVVILLVSLGI
jgi:hypothetical protein